LVQKAGLIELFDDDRATLLGALLELAARLRNDGQEEADECQEGKASDLVTRWRRRGLRAFDADKDATEIVGTREEGQPQMEAGL